MKPTGEAVLLNQPFRSQYHFTPPQKWLNDPNGLVYFDGEYHLFYQYHPDGTVWGPMHWGHAVSADLVNWQHLPIALYPDDLGTIFSGSAVIDWHNTAGFGDEAMVAVFTHHTPETQRQSLAYSTDRGRTWSKYIGNPVLETPKNIRDFRDPKVFWYDNANGNGHWVMVLVAGISVLFYTSPDLKTWDLGSGFGLGYGSYSGVWETPDLFELPVDGGPEARWVLTVGVIDGVPTGGSGMQYFVGHFDGHTFSSENPKETTLWVDYGADFYAAQSWSDMPDRRRVWLGWMNNWAYARDIPTSTWRGAMTIPRELGLTHTPDGIRLIQQPVAEVQRLRSERKTWKNEIITADGPFQPDVWRGPLEIIADFQVDENTSAEEFGLRLQTGEDESTVVGYDINCKTLFVDRSQSGQVNFSPAFPGIHTAKCKPAGGIVRLHIFVDRSSVEVFANSGQVAITERIFPNARDFDLEIFSTGGMAVMNSLEIYKLNAATFLVGK